MYIDHYGLTGQPFQLTPDARFWFESRTHRKAMAYLGYGLAQGEGFIVVTGEIGAGKSTLVAYLMATIDRARLNAISLVSTQVEGDDMLRLAAQGLGIATGAVEKARLLDAVEQKLEQELRAGKRTLLIVDEAQNLPVSALEELRMLSNFQVAGKALLQIVLLGQPEFRDKLASARPRAAAPARHRHPSSRSDGRRRGRSLCPPSPRMCVGWQGRPEFAPGAFAAVHAEPAAFPAASTSSPTGCCSTPRSRRPRLIGAEAVEAVAEDLRADAPAAPTRPAAAPREEERVLPLRSARPPLPAANELADLRFDRADVARSPTPSC